MADHPFEFSGRAIHVWVLRIRASNALASRLEAVLAAEELHRADRFHFEHLRQSFVITHGAVRHLLAGYVRMAPKNIRFRYGLRGKPAIEQSEGIEFNLTHSGELALAAVSLGCPVGIDVERLRPLEDMQTIAEHFFCPDEADEIMSLPLDQRELAFFTCWTRKEAYIKALGDGLHVPLDRFRVTVRPNEDARLVRVTDEPTAPEEWNLEDLRVSQEYAAALAYRDRRRTVLVLPERDAAELVG
jgi:4'-phosphopantetheinyl transferase